MQCPKCGTWFDTQKLSCPQCGTPIFPDYQYLSSDYNPYVSNQPKKKKLNDRACKYFLSSFIIDLIIAVALSVCVVALCYVSIEYAGTS